MRNFFIYLFIFSSLFIKAQTALDIVSANFKTDKDLSHASYGFCVLNAKTGKTIKEFQSNLALIPASTLKIVTTGAALGILNKNYTYKTNFSVLYDGDSIGTSKYNVLKIYGAGDPSFNSSYFYNNDSAFFTQLIKRLKTIGIKKINTITVDNSCFDNTVSSNWIWGDIANYFGADANGLSYKDNKFSVYFNSGLTNTEAKMNDIKSPYFLKTMTIKTNVLSYGSEDEAYVYGNPYEYNRTITGTIPPNKLNYEVEAQTPEPDKYFEFDLKNELIKNNLFTLSEKQNTTIDEKKLKSKWVYTHTSPTLEKIIFYTNLKSNNHYAESILKTIGLASNKKQGSTQNGINEVERFWKQKNIDITGLHMVDGSGLSRANTITASVEANILSNIYTDSLIFEPFYKSLPVAGKSGSMSNLCKGTFAENNMRAKTGYINKVRSYCGYVKTKKGETLAFSIIFNNYNCSAKEMKNKIEDFLVSLVEL